MIMEEACPDTHLREYTVFEYVQRKGTRTTGRSVSGYGLMSTAYS